MSGDFEVLISRIEQELIDLTQVKRRAAEAMEAANAFRTTRGLFSIPRL